jgi:hypothetical protein
MKPILGLAGEGKISEVRVLNDAEYEEYKRAVMRLLRFSSDQQLFLIVRLNYEDFRKLLDQYFWEYIKNPSMSWPRVERMTLNINRHILNYLSTVRMFLDHSEANLKERYGKDSQRVKRFKDACSYAYDNNFSYRFLYRLRNYAQHCGLPLGVLTLHSKAVGPSPEDIHHSLTIRFNRDELLRKYKLWGTQLKKEVQKLPSEIEINPHVAEMMKCLEKINLTLFEDDLPELIQSAKNVQKLVTETRGMPGVPCILWLENVVRTQEGKVERLNVHIEWIPTHLVEMIIPNTEVRGI